MQKPSAETLRMKYPRRNDFHVCKLEVFNNVNKFLTIFFCGKCYKLRQQMLHREKKGNEIVAFVTICKVYLVLKV